MGRLALVFLLSACAATSGAPRASLSLEEMPPHSVEVSASDVRVWGTLDETPGKLAPPNGFAQAETLARTELMKFVDVAVQQLDLQLQAAGQASTTNAEAQAIMQNVTDLNLGTSERASQNVEHSDRFVVRYVFARASVEEAMVDGLSTRPNKLELVRRTLTSFDPDEAGSQAQSPPTTR